MDIQFTQQLLVADEPMTFLFTEKFIDEYEHIYSISILNHPEIKPFTMARKNDHFEIVDADVPKAIKDIRFNLNYAINNYHVMMSLLSDDPQQSSSSTKKEKKDAR